ncbi:MAG TPA: helicase-related protein [Hyphomicrobiaceae bacterium]|nr:helicase-related protein [Hyphomicrobiaceae bacterium]
MSRNLGHHIRNVTAVLGPTNTGKTHLAIERMLGHQSGLIGLPLRLLAREVYDKVVARVGTEAVALITGEEKIKPERPRYWVCTVEAMPRVPDVDFLAVDEVQLAADPERGHVFTDRLLHARGREETLLLGAQTMRPAIAELIPGANFISRPRLSKLTYAGEKKITRLPTRSAVVAFSASEVYAIAELMRRQRGGAAVVLGALSPRTRNAQVALYQSGDVDFLVATDAIGMGLNLDVDHVAFAGVRKFDGQVHRDLTPAELSQIAGRAGRHMNDGTFGVTASVPSFSADVIERLETHTFDNVKSLQWRSRDLDFASLDRLRDSLRRMPDELRLARARMADDTLALENVSADPGLAALATTPEAVARLWDVCQVPDYRKISVQDHAQLVGTLYNFLMGPTGRIPADWFANQVAFADRTDGDIDTLANRIAHIRTWTFVSNRGDWLDDPEHWQGRTRAIEDTLSDALHECLTQRFIDRRTSALMRGLKEKDDLVADIGQDGAVQVQNHYVGRLQGFRFFPDTEAEGIHGKATRSAAAHVLSKELAMRARRVSAAKNDAFRLTPRGQILWRDEEIGRLEAGEDLLKPSAVLMADEAMSAGDREKVQERLSGWIGEIIGERLKPLVDLAAAKDIAGLARGIAFRLSENLGVLRREAVSEEVRALDQPARAQLRGYGVRFGAFNIYFPALLKPAAVELALTLWLLKHGEQNGIDPVNPPTLPRAGLTSIVVDKALPPAFYRVAGFHPCGGRAVRIDMLERLADLIRPLVAWRLDPASSNPPPKGATGDGGFRVTPDMMSILGCSSSNVGEILQELGFRLERVPVKAVERPVVVEKAVVATAAEAPPAPAESEDGKAAPAEAAAVADPAAAEAPTGADAAAPGGDGDAGLAAAVEAAVEAAPAAQDDAAPAEASAPAAEADDATAAAVAEPAPEPKADAVANDAAAEPKFEEIWRPRRQGRHQNDRRRHRGAGPPEAGREEAPPHQHQRRGRDGARDRRRGDSRQGGGEHRTADARTAGGESRPDSKSEARSGDHRHKRNDNRHDRRHGASGRREDRQQRSFRHSASPPSAKAGFDPDSPFAALSSLKAALEKQSQE